MTTSEQALSDSENTARLTLLLAVSANGIIIIDEKGIVQAYSPANERLIGYTVQEMLGKDARILVAPQFVSEFKGCLEEHAQTDAAPVKMPDKLIRCRRKDGSEFLLKLFVGQGNFRDEVFYVGIVRNNPARLNTVNVVYDDKQCVDEILEIFPEALALMDEEGYIKSFSPAAERLFGYVEEDVLDKSIKMLVPSFTPIDEMGTSSKALSRITEGQRKDGSSIPIEICIEEMRLGDHCHFAGFIRDRGHSADEFSRMQDVQSVLQRDSRLSAMGQMAFALAHELNQPLTAVVNYVNAARHTMKSIDDPQVRLALDYIEKAQEQANRAGQIIRHLRQYIEKGKSKRSLENMNEIIKELINFAPIASTVVGSKIFFDLHSDLPMIRIDKIQIQQVLLNLIRNASEAMAKSATREMTISTSMEGSKFVVISIADTGTGIAPEMVKRLFTPFASSKPGGMGIGLSICREIMKAHEGSISMTPVKSGGSCFALRIPVGNPKEQKNAA